MRNIIPHIKWCALLTILAILEVCDRVKMFMRGVCIEMHYNFDHYI